MPTPTELTDDGVPGASCEKYHCCPPSGLVIRRRLFALPSEDPVSEWAPKTTMNMNMNSARQTNPKEL